MKTPIGFPDYVKVSTDGRVFLEERILPRGAGFMRFSKKELKPKTDHCGYARVQFRVNGKHKEFRIHRLVLMAHSGSPGDGLDANHKNGNRLDNRLENLEWCTRSENHIHAYRRLGRVSATKGKPSPNKGKFNDPRISREIVGTNIATGETICFASAADAGRNGYSRDGIAHSLIGDQKSSGGFTWRFV